MVSHATRRAGLQSALLIGLTTACTPTSSGFQPPDDVMVLEDIIEDSSSADHSTPATADVGDVVTLDVGVDTGRTHLDAVAADRPPGVDVLSSDAGIPDVTDVTRADIGLDAPIDAALDSTPRVDTPSADALIDAAIGLDALDVPFRDIPADTTLDTAPRLDALTTDVGDASVADRLPASPNCPARVVELGRLPNVRANGERPDFWMRDFDGDGRVDIATTRLNSTTYRYIIRFWRGLGGVTFADPVESSFAVPRYGYGYQALADVNGDSRLDFVLGRVSEVPRRSSVTASIFGDGGVFSVPGFERDLSACSFGDDERINGWIVIDVDRDGRADVLSTISLGGLGSEPVGLSLARGGLYGFESARCVATATSATMGFPVNMVGANEFARGDFDGDGELDLVARIGRRLRYFRNSGPSTFTEIGDLVETDNFPLYVDTVRGRRPDRLLRVHIGYSSPFTEVDYFAVDATRGLSPARPLVSVPEYDPTGWGIAQTLVLGDLTGDGRTDILEASARASFEPSSRTFTLACEQGDGRWVMTTGDFPSGIAGFGSLQLDETPARELYSFPTETTLAFYRLQ